MYASDWRIASTAAPAQRSSGGGLSPPAGVGPPGSPSVPPSGRTAGRVAASAPEELGNAPGQLLQYMLDHMLAGHEQDDDVTVLVMHVPLDAGVPDVAAGERSWASR